ncbi:NADH:flavin oxidoreductase [Streptomyces sp. NBC_01456]|uniref:NADH:flavin oxidoreductase n=1 Tax=unclassified Streptomyces TaxID=2593676 RepID=UPI002E37C106|nr:MULTISPECIES: NADH:flavin oxidoreductase [unclassified Streptomyces]
MSTSSADVAADFAPLFTPLSLGRRTARNRIFQAPMSVGYANPDGTVTEREIQHYARRAQGGTGVVVTENFAISSAGRQMPLQTLVSDEDQLPGLQQLAAEIRRHGALSIVQIVHAGRYAGPWEEYESRRRLAPSAIPFELTRGRVVTPQEITPEEIEESIEEFVRAAQLCERAGFDGVDVHAAQGFLISGFLSPRTNQRTDEWGGDFVGRTRFLLEVVRRIVANTGPDFVVGVHLLSDERVEGGWSLDDAERLAPLLESEGAAFLFAIPATFETMRMPHNAGMLAKPGFSLDDSAALQRAVRIPVVANGGLGDPREAVRALQTHQGSAVGLARPLFVDPDWPTRVQAGTPEARRTCPCNPPLCLQTQLTGALCNHWPETAQTRGFFGYDEGPPA